MKKTILNLLFISFLTLSGCNLSTSKRIVDVPNNNLHFACYNADEIKPFDNRGDITKIYLQKAKLFEEFDKSNGREHDGLPYVNYSYSGSLARVNTEAIININMSEFTKIYDIIREKSFNKCQIYILMHEAGHVFTNTHDDSCNFMSSEEHENKANLWAADKMKIGDKELMEFRKDCFE